MYLVYFSWENVHKKYQQLPARLILGDVLMKIYRSMINDYPYVKFSRWEFRPLELIQLYRDFGKNDPTLIDAVIKFDPVYVRFRELDALENRINVFFERIHFNRDDITSEFPEGFKTLFETLSIVLRAKKDLIEGVDPAELTKCRQSLAQIASELELRELIEFDK